MINEKIKIEDNYLQSFEFEEIYEAMVGVIEFPWYYNNFVDYQVNGKDGDVRNFQFTHMFYLNSTPTDDESIIFIIPILRMLTPITLVRVKANLLTRTPKIVENEFHVDVGIAEKKLEQLTTSILYINTNNGYTEFEDGTRVKSVANRMVTFPANMKHRGTSCTDENIRVVINFNYFK